MGKLVKKKPNKVGMDTYVTKTEKLAVQRASRREGISISEFIRRAVKKEVEVCRPKRNK
jgi:hypothetical protein